MKDKEITLTLTQSDLNLLDILLDSGMRQGKAAIMNGKEPVIGEDGKILYMAKACVSLETKISKQITEQSKEKEDAKI